MQVFTLPADMTTMTNTASGKTVDTITADMTEILTTCRAILDADGVVLLPTETVYGLVCRWDRPAAREKIYQLKLRETSKLLAMFAASADSAAHFGAVFTPHAIGRAHV